MLARVGGFLGAKGHDSGGVIETDEEASGLASGRGRPGSNLRAPQGDEAECLGWRGRLFCQSGTRRGKVGWQGPGEEGEEEEGANLVMCILYFHSFSFSTVLCCWQQGWKEEKKERGEV